MKMTTSQVVKLRVLIRKHTEAQVAFAVKGGADVEAEARAANRELRNFIKRLYHDS